MRLLAIPLRASGWRRRAPYGQGLAWPWGTRHGHEWIIRVVCVNACAWRVQGLWHHPLHPPPLSVVRWWYPTRTVNVDMCATARVNGRADSTQEVCYCARSVRAAWAYARCPYCVYARCIIHQDDFERFHTNGPFALRYP